MKCWDYTKVAPWVSVTLIGERFIKEWALIDTGASYCVLHPKFAKALGLRKIDTVSLAGFGSRKPIKADLYPLKIDINGFREKIDVACINEEYYPENVPKVVIGRNFLNKYHITLDGKKVCIIANHINNRNFVPNQM